MPQASTNTLTTTSSPTSAEVPLPQALAQPALPKEASPAQPPVQSDTAQSLVPWQPQEAKVTQFPELPFPADTVNVTAFLEIEVSLDKEGKATHVRVVRESPQAMFTEWVWEMGMKGQYKPRVTSAGPVESKLRVRIDIAPGMPLEVR